MLRCVSPLAALARGEVIHLLGLMRRTIWPLEQGDLFSAIPPPHVGGYRTYGF